MRKAGPDMQVIEKAYELSVWGANHVAKFPRSHRFTLGDRLENRLYLLLELLLRAKYTRDRQPLLTQANLELELLRFQLRLAKDLRCLALESYGAGSRLLDEVGRLVGGWLKQSPARSRGTSTPADS